MVDGPINDTPIGEGGEVQDSTNSQITTTNMPEVPNTTEDSDVSMHTDDIDEMDNDSELPAQLVYLTSKGYNLDKDILNIKNKPDKAYRAVKELTDRLKDDIMPLVTITEANWDKNVHTLAKLIREEWGSKLFNGTGLDFILRTVVYHMLPGEKGAEFKDKTFQQSLGTILDTLETVIDKEGHPLFVGKQAFSLGGNKHQIDDDAIKTLTKFLDTLKTFKTDDKKLIYLLQATCDPEVGLQDGWEKETSLSRYIQKVRLRNLTRNSQKVSVGINNINTSKPSRGRVNKPNSHRRPRKSHEVICKEALQYFKEKFKVGEITSNLKKLVAKRHNDKMCLTCGKGNHYYKKCDNPNLRQ